MWVVLAPSELSCASHQMELGRQVKWRASSKNYSFAGTKHFPLGVWPRLFLCSLSLLVLLPEQEYAACLSIIPKSRKIPFFYLLWWHRH